MHKDVQCRVLAAPLFTNFSPVFDAIQHSKSRFGPSAIAPAFWLFQPLLVDMAPKHLWPILIIVSAAVALYLLYLAFA
jgi:hypothetical protein